MWIALLSLTCTCVWCVCMCARVRCVVCVCVCLQNGKQVGRGHTLTLADATYATSGEYVCEVTVSSLPALRTSGSVHIIVQGTSPQRPPGYESAETPGVRVHRDPRGRGGSDPQGRS